MFPFILLAQIVLFALALTIKYPAMPRHAHESQSSNVRKALAVSPAQPTMEGAGVRLKKRLAPWTLGWISSLCDDFSSKGHRTSGRDFPSIHIGAWETITYVISGRSMSRQSGNSGSIRSGDVQWMTAGSGIIHAEMPRAAERLWHPAMGEPAEGEEDDGSPIQGRQGRGDTDR